MATTTNSRPIAVADRVAVSEDGVLQATGNLLSNDTDADRDTLAVTAVNGLAAGVGTVIAGTYGSLVLGANGQYTYILANAQANVQALEAGRSVTDVFRYTVSDGASHTITTQNLLPYSEALDNPAWVRFSNNGASATVMADAALSPIGSRTAELLSMTGSGTGIYTGTDVSGQSTFSAWIRLAAGDGLADEAEVQRSFGGPEEIGRLFLTDHLLAFEITSIVLLVAAVGGVVLGTRSKAEDEEEGVRA